jgi:N-acetylglucosamine-6-phosphate deacetylase
MPEEFALVGGRFVLPDGIRTDVAVVCRGATILDITDEPEPGPRKVDVGGRLVTPGLIDIHVHGALGNSFGSPDPAAYGAILHHLARQGVTSAYASLVSAPVGELVRTVEFVAGYRPPEGATRLLGVHLEGPFIAVDQCGAHDPAMLRAPSAADTEVLVAHADTLGMVTLAPELPGAIELTRRLANAGVLVAIGHSSAPESAFRDAVAAGARHLTHLWSGQSNLTRSGPWRVPGLVELSLASDELTAEVIADGRHLPPELLNIARRCLGDRLCVVSDATPGAGLAAGSRYRAGTVGCEVRDGVGIVVGLDSFGGSTTMLNGMLDHLVNGLGWPVTEAVAMATSIPARIAGVEDRRGILAPGYDADIAIFDEHFTPWATLLNGVCPPVGSPREQEKGSST